jgi:DNA-binding NarL/FixJ family response regulator
LRSKHSGSAVDGGNPARERVLSVVIVDDDDAFRAGLGEMLTAYGLQVAGTAASGSEALELVPSVSPEVVLMDLAMPLMTGVEATRKLAIAAPDVNVLILTLSEEQEEVLDAMFAGACGYVLKGTPPASLVADIRAAAEGDCVMSTSVAAKVFASFVRRQPGQSPSTPLSKRELEVLRMIADGKPNSEIAKTLVISPYTVRNHISNLLRKLQLENRTQAARYAARHGLG